MSLILVLGVVMIGMCGFMHALDQRSQHALRLRMDGILTRRGQDTLDEIELIIRENRLVLEGYHLRARQARALGQYAEAAERMRRGCRAIEMLAPDFLTALAALRALARTVSAIVSVAPVSRRRFRRAELWGLAAAGEIVHELLVTGRQQIVLRLHVAGAIFCLALRQLSRLGRRIVAEPQDAWTWTGIDALVADLGTTSAETAVTARNLVQALDAVDLGYVVGHNAHL